METSSKPARRVLTPGPDHPIFIEPNPRRVRITVGATALADSRGALTLREAGCLPVQYIPRQDVSMQMLERSDHQTYCPYKGECSYFSIPSAGERGRNAVWTYEAPFAAVSTIKDYLAFYPQGVDSITEEP